MLQELAEQLSSSFDNKVKHQPQGHARTRARGALFSPGIPGDRITHTGAIQISRSYPPTSDLREKWSSTQRNENACSGLKPCQVNFKEVLFSHAARILTFASLPLFC